MADKLRMGAVGEADVILAFKAIGAITIPAVTEDEVSQALHRLSQDKVPLIFITENAARLAPEAMSQYERSPGTAVIPIPGIGGSDGFGRERVRENVIKAIGADILIKQDRNEG